MYWEFGFSNRFLSRVEYSRQLRFLSVGRFSTNYAILKFHYLVPMIPLA